MCIISTRHATLSGLYVSLLLFILYVSGAECFHIQTNFPSRRVGSVIRPNQAFEYSPHLCSALLDHFGDRDTSASSNKDMHIAIVGGGPGGMTTALSLFDAGFHNVHVYEAALTIKELGVGMNMQPTAVRELIELGLGEAISSTGIPTGEIRYFNKFGQDIYREPRGLAAGYMWPQYSIHRGKLLSLLHEAVKDRLGEERVHTGHKLVDCGNKNNGAWADFHLRHDDQQCLQYQTARIEADLIIGCDGVHSAVRKVLIGEATPKKWSGITMFRGLTRAKPFLTGRTMTICGHLEQEFVIYPISKEAEDEGDSLINWVALLKTNEENDDDLEEDWSMEANQEDLVQNFSDFDLGFIDIPDLIRGAENVYKYPMCDRAPLHTWVHGCITLLGDAAHPMWPIGSNGATQTILDARVLARNLALEPSLEAALQRYDEERRDATAAIATANRLSSETSFLELIQEQAPNGFDNLDAIITKEELDSISTGYKKLAGFFPETLNKRQSLSVITHDAPPKPSRLS